jgi:hypothetical protein
MDLRDILVSFLLKTFSDSKIKMAAGDMSHLDDGQASTTT